MAKELRQGKEIFDGKEINDYALRFTGSAELDADVAAPIAYDDLLTFIVTARVTGVTIKDDPKIHQRKRVNTARLEDLIVLDSAKAAYVYGAMGQKVNGVNDGLIESSAGITDAGDEYDFNDVTALKELIDESDAEVSDLFASFNTDDELADL